MNALPERIDWKYSFGLELTDAGFDFSFLSAFRQRLAEEGGETLLLDRLLEVCKQRIASTHVLARVRSLCNLECVAECLRAALNDSAAREPDWLLQQAGPEWFGRYSHRAENDRLPKGERERTAFAQQIGADGPYLLQALEARGAPARSAQLQSV